MERIIVTNNPKVKEKYNTVFIDCYGFGDVLYTVRNFIHRHWKLLTHPLSGSIKPNETPYKTVVLEKGKELDVDSLALIEEAINRYQTFQNSKPLPEWSPSILEDFATIDLSLIESIPIDLGGI